MPSELLHFPPSYTLVGLYRLITDPLIRGPVLDKVKHATIRGLIVSGIYAVGSWSTLDWFIRRFLISGGGSWFGFGKGRVGEALKESATGRGNVWVGFAGFGAEVDLVLYTHVLILLPQISSILRFFVYKNLKLARSRAYALTVASRDKPSEFWSQGYIEEWQEPPQPGRGDYIGKEGRRHAQATWISWILWWPVQLVLRHYVFIPLSPSLPLFTPLITASLRSLITAEYLHQPYFVTKGMSSPEIWRWVEERKWAYRAFGFTSSLVESVPVLGLFLSISNRIGAAMWAFDLEKRQHLFANKVFQPLPREQTGFYGMGSVTDLGVNVQEAEAEIERKWSKKRAEELQYGQGGEGEEIELKGLSGRSNSDL